VKPVPAIADEIDRLEQRFGWSLTPRFVDRGGIWYPADGSTETVSYPESGHLTIAEVEDESYWFRHRNHAIANLVLRRELGGALWDVGAGTGVVAAHLQQRGISVVAVEPGPDGARFASERGLTTVICATLEQIALPERSIAAVGLFDVIEHLEDPGELLATAARVLRDEGSLVVSVPAYQWLWSQTDVAAGHCRRYTLTTLDRDVLAHGFRRCEARYLFHSLVLPVAIGRTLRSVVSKDPDAALEAAKGELRPSARLVSAAIDAVLALEDLVDRVFPLPFGTSILARYERTP
jgi:SAM-dependent methyltransferase